MASGKSTKDNIRGLKPLMSILERREGHDKAREDRRYGEFYRSY